MLGWIIEPIVKAKVSQLLEVFATPEFKSAAIQLGLKGALAAIPTMRVQLDTNGVKFPEPDTTVPIIKGLLNAVEEKLKTLVK